MKIITTLIYILCFIFFTSFCFKAYSDLLYLKGSASGIKVEIKKSDRHSVIAAIRKENIVDISVNSLDARTYPDLLKVGSKNKPLHCKVLKIEDKVILAQIPMYEVASFNITFSKPTTNEYINSKTTYKKIDKLELDNRFEIWQTEEGEQIIPKDKGMIKGTILSQGNPLPKCQVKIHRLLPKGFLFFKTYKQTEYYETITDDTGNYFFENIPAGAYKLYWKRTLGEPWMKRIETEPDIIVQERKQAIVSPLDIDLGTIE